MNSEIKFKVIVLSKIEDKVIEISKPLNLEEISYYLYKRRDRDKDCIEYYEYSQDTGLLDRNGKEIYCGDILEHWGNKYIVPNVVPLSRFYEGENVLPNQEGSDDWISNSQIDWEVIGNIFEDKHLINEKK